MNPDSTKSCGIARAVWLVDSWSRVNDGSQEGTYWNPSGFATDVLVSDSERVNSALSMSGEAVIDSFMREYQKRIQSFLLETSGFDYSRLLDSSPGEQSELVFDHPPTPDLVEYFLNVVIPAAMRAKSHLAVASVHDLQSMKAIGLDLLELADADPTPEERENWLYSIGRQYWSRLGDEGLFMDTAVRQPDPRLYVLAA